MKDLKNMKSGENLYYNLRLDNISNPANVGGDIRAQQIIKTGEILHHQSDFRVAIDFFSLRPTIPIFYAQIVEGNNNDIYAMQCGLSFRDAAGVFYPSRLVFIPDISSGLVNLPKSPFQNGGLQDFSTRFYAVYTIWNMLDMMNNALQASYISFNAINPGIHSSAPFWQYNSETERVELVYEESYYSGANRARLYINAQLQNFFNATRIVFNNAQGDPLNFSDFQQLLDSNNALPYALPGATLPVPPLAPAYRIIKQEYDALYFWCNIKSILFSSSSISTMPEYLPSAYNPNTVVSSNYQTFNQPSRSILAYYDIIVGGTGVDWRQNFYNSPNYRKWLDLEDDGTLNSLNLTMEIQLTNGVTLPMFIPINGTIDVKLVFQKK